MAADADARMQQFARDRAAKRMGVLVCVACGSAALDHRSLAVIRQCSVKADLAVAFDESRQARPSPRQGPRGMTSAARRRGSARTIDFGALRAAVTVADVLAAHGHELRRDRRCCCPLCASGNPTTMSTYADGRRWRCWSCGEHGDATDLEA